MKEINSSVFANVIVGVTGGSLENNVDFFWRFYSTIIDIL